jgi:CDP-glucose 4,6-dehydratase
VIGGGDWATDRLIPDLVRALSQNQVLRLRYPYAVRPWQHVLEPLSGYLQLAERIWHYKSAYTRGWNFGPTEEPRTVLDIVHSAQKIFGGNLKCIHSEKPKNKETTYLSIDSSLVQEMIGWKTKLDFETMLKWTFSWYHNYYHKTNDIRQFTLQQIHEYSKMVESAPNDTSHIN